MALRCLIPASLVAVAGMLCGCGETKTTVKGQLLLDDQPLAGARIDLWPKADLNLDSSGTTTDDQGYFELPDKYVPRKLKPGEYRLLVTKYPVPKGLAPDKAPLPLPMEGLPGTRSLVPGIYADKERSPLGVEIQ